MRPRLAIVLLALALPLAGCFGGDEAPTTRSVAASGGKVSAGWAYNGSGVSAAGATLEGAFDNAANTGSVNVSFDHLGSKYVVSFDRFAQAEGKEFMDGGIAFDLDEHGDTGVADASIPKIHALVAAWGKATVTRDGGKLVGKAGELWSAHLMVSRDTVRGADGRILKADGSAPYDPAAPGDALRVENDPQAILWIKSPDGENAAREPFVVSESLTCTGPACVESVDIAAEPGARSLAVNVSFAGAQDPVPTGVGRVTVTLRDAGGNVTQTQESTLGPGASPVTSFRVEGSAIAGPYTLEVSGTGAYTATVTGVVEYADAPFLVLTWDEVAVS